MAGSATPPLPAAVASGDTVDLVDWRLAGRLGSRLAGGEPLLVRAAWVDHFSALSARADLAVAERTGLGGDLPAPRAEPLERGEWIEANLGNLRDLLTPVAERVATRQGWQQAGTGHTFARAATRTATALQVGGLLGYVAQRVLGQYDLPMPGARQPGMGVTDPAVGPAPAGGHGGTLLYVVPNIVEIERRHRFRPAHFRLWIALHETAHRRQFEGVPWLAPYLHGLLEEFLTTVDVDEQAARRVTRRARGLVRRALAGEPIEVVDVLVSPEQRQLVNRLQAVMSVLEGHGELVMNLLGVEMVPGYERMHRALHDRRLAPARADRVLQDLLGLRQKLDQYARGHAFLRRVYERGGMDAVNLVFVGPDALPDLDELDAPDRWLSRVG